MSFWYVPIILWVLPFIPVQWDVPRESFTFPTSAMESASYPLMENADQLIFKWRNRREMHVKELFNLKYWKTISFLLEVRKFIVLTSTIDYCELVPKSIEKKTQTTIQLVLLTHKSLLSTQSEGKKITLFSSLFQAHFFLCFFIFFLAPIPTSVSWEE